MDEKLSGKKNKFNLDDVPEKTRILILFVALLVLGGSVVLVWLAGFNSFLRYQSQNKNGDDISEIFSDGIEEVNQLQELLMELRQVMPKSALIEQQEEDMILIEDNNEYNEESLPEQDGHQDLLSDGLDENSVKKIKEKLESRDN